MKGVRAVKLLHFLALTLTALALHPEYSAIKVLKVINVPARPPTAPRPLIRGPGPSSVLLLSPPRSS